MTNVEDMTAEQLMQAAADKAPAPGFPRLIHRVFHRPFLRCMYGPFGFPQPGMASLPRMRHTRKNSA